MNYSISETENSLLAGLKAGDTQAIKALYKLALPACMNLVENNKGNQEDARDIFQEALMALYKNLSRPNFQIKCAVKTYLYSIARNLWYQRLNKQAKGGLKLVMDKDPEMEYIIVAEDEMEGKIARESQHELIAEVVHNYLKPDCRQLLLSFYFKKQAIKEIAVAMDYTEGFTKVKKNRCMKSLKEEVFRRSGELENF